MTGKFGSIIGLTSEIVQKALQCRTKLNGHWTIDKERFLDERAGISDDAVWFLSRPYVSGQGLDALVDRVAGNFDKWGVTATVDLLGEGLVGDASATSMKTMRFQADRNMDTMAETITRLNHEMYDGVLQPMNKDPRIRPSVSIKPSSVGIRVGPSLDWPEGYSEACYNCIRNVARQADDAGLMLEIDMEDLHWTDWTLDVYARLLDEGLENLAVALQTRLDRTGERDVPRIIDLAKNYPVAVRLCKGIYEERGAPGVIPPTKEGNVEMKERLLVQGEQLLRGGVYLKFATHDVDYIHRFMRDIVVAQHIAPTQFEIQMLEGVPGRDRLQRSLANGSYYNDVIYADQLTAFQMFESEDMDHVNRLMDAGVIVRRYVPWAREGPAGRQSAIRYCRRRLSRNEDMFQHALSHGPALYLKSVRLSLKD